MYDLLIEGGTVIDGSGAPGFKGDVAIKDGRIVAVGPRLEGDAARVIAANGRAVAPGFIDPHTHFDVQLLWDGAAKPALEHGITAVVPGNCSLSLAPLKATDRKALVGMFQQIEEMPPEAFTEAFDWTWEDFAGYREAIEPGLSINVAPLVGHSVIRLWVMGAAANQRAANAAEIAAMQDLLRQCLVAGAVGLSTSFVDVDENGRPVPSRFAAFDELDALSAVLGEQGRMLQIVPEFYATDITIARIDQLADLSLRHNIPTTFSPLFDSSFTPDSAPRALRRVEEQFASARPGLAADADPADRHQLQPAPPQPVLRPPAALGAHPAPAAATAPSRPARPRDRRQDGRGRRAGRRRGHLRRAGGARRRRGPGRARRPHGGGHRRRARPGLRPGADRRLAGARP